MSGRGINVAVLSPLLHTPKTFSYLKSKFLHPLRVNLVLLSPWEA